MGERDKPIFNIGITLIVLIFMNLCLIVFAVLALENAVSDRNLTEKTAEHTKAYYQAYSDVEEHMALASEQLSDPDRKSDYKKEGMKKLEEQLQAEGYELTQENGEWYISYQSQVSEYQALLGRAKIVWNKKGKQPLEIEEARLVQTGSWNADQSVKVFQGKGR